MNSGLHSKSVCRASLLLGAATASLCAMPALAQDAVPPEQRGEMGTTPPKPGIEEIVVTARKREETTQDVPVAITAIGEETIQKYNLNSLESVAASTPQFTVGRAGSGSGATLVLRGIGSNTTSIGLEQSVAVVVDSVYYGQGRTINEGFFDLGQIEILKGPQALFFGKNATAGVISMATKNPGDELELIGRVGYEFNAEEIQTELIASGPITDTFGARLAVSYEKQFGSLFPNFAQPETWRLTDVATGNTRFLEGVQPDDEPGTTNLIARLTLAWDPTDRLSINLKGSMTDAKSESPLLNYTPYWCPTGSSALNPAIPCGEEFRNYGGAPPAEVSQDIPWGRDDGQPFNDYRSYSVTGTVNYDLGNILITNVANYHWNRNRFGLDGNIIWSAPIGVFGTEDTTWESFSNEFRVTSDLGGVFDFMLGGLYQDSLRDYNNATAQAGLENSNAPEGYRFVGNSKDSETAGETIAIFGQAIFRPMPDVEVAGGVRYTHETKDSFFVQPYSNPALTAVFSPGVRITADQTFENYSPEITVSYQPSDAVTIYAGYKTAYKSGGFSNSGILGPLASVADFAFDPETAKGFEGGIKTQLFDRQLRLNLGAFWYDIDNLQIDFFNSPVFAFTTYNAATATTKGIEMDFQFAPYALYGFEVHGSLNYNDAFYDDYPDAPCYAGQTIAEGCFTTVPRPTQDLSGKKLANAPEWTGSLGASYETPVGSGLKLNISADGRFKSNYIVTAFGNPYARQDAYQVLDAQVRLSTEDDRYQVALIGRNLTDTFYVNGGQDGPSTGTGTGTANGIPADQYGFVADPRTVTLQFSVRY